MNRDACSAVGQHANVGAPLRWLRRALPGAVWEVCRKQGITPAQALRSMLALLLASDAGDPHVRIAAFAHRSQTEATIASVRLDPDGSIPQTARAWSSNVLSLVGQTATPATLRALLAAQRLSQLTVGERPEAISRHCPLAVHARPGEQPDLFLVSPSGAWSEAALDSLANQLDVTAKAFVDQPSTSLAGLVEQLPALRFSLTLAANSGHEMLLPVMAYWEEETGLAISVDAVQLGQQEIGLPVRRFPTPRPAGATVIVTHCDEWERDQGTSSPRLLTAPPAGLDLARLVNGAFVAHHSANETRELDQEIFARRTYMRHGIDLADGATVVDVGANIGLFTLFAHWETGRVRIQAVEPVAELAALTRVNAGLYGADVTVHPIALGAENGTAGLTYYPRSSLQSGIYADHLRDDAIIRQYVSNQLDGSDRLTDLQPAGSDVQMLLADRTAPEQRRVPVRTLSTLIEEQELEQIDLLKIDVERSEQAVLEGIDSEHWALIQQLVIEVHDLDRRVERMRDELERHGFSVAVEQEPLYANTEIFMLYGTRRPKRRPRSTTEGRRTIVAAANRWQRSSLVPLHVAILKSDSHMPDQQESLKALADELPGVALLELSAPTLSTEVDSTTAATVGTAILRRATATLRPVIKAILVDADDVLWGGVCGEVGPANVTLDRHRVALQEHLLEQRARGRLLCLCSRNNLSDVREVFATNPEMPLRLEHFATTRITWGPKSSSVSSIAQELSVRPESMVFVDDDPAVRSEIRLLVPHVTVVELPEDPSLRVAALAATWALQPEPQTAEDELRVSFKRHEHARATLAQRSPSFEEFLAQLDLAVDIRASTTEDVERISQLARRTNQFNLSLHQHAPPDVQRLLAGSTFALTTHVRDRFGDYGIVGFVAGIRTANGCVTISDWFLSCRALGKNVEWAMLQAVGELALAHGAHTVVLSAAQGERNAPIHSLLERVLVRCEAHRRGQDSAIEVSARTLASLSWRSIDEARPAPARRNKSYTQTAGLPRHRWPAPERVSARELGERLHYLGTPQRRLITPIVAPKTATEQRLATIWREVLGLSAIGSHDNLFALGADSLAAAAICASMRRAGCLITLESLLDEPTIAGVSRRIDTTVEREEADRPVGDHDDEPQATDGQRRVWAAEQVGRAPGAQIIPLAYRIDGPIGIERLRAAIEATSERHRALRSGLVPRDGKLLRIDSRVPISLIETQLDRNFEAPEQAAQRQSKEFFAEQFDLLHGPMVRALLLKLGPESHLLLLAIHHSAADGWSIGLIQRDISAAYTSPGCLSNSRQRDDIEQYAQSVRQREHSGALSSQLKALTTQLGSRAASSHLLRSDMPRGELSADPRRLRVELPEELLLAIRELAERNGTTPFAVYLAAFQLVLAVQDDRSFVSIGSPTANRDEPGHETIVGFIANIVPIGIAIDWDCTLIDHLVRSSALARTALTRASVPYGLVLRTLHGDAYRFEPPFTALLTLQPAPRYPLVLTGAAVQPHDTFHVPLPFELMLDIEERSDGGCSLLRFDGALFRGSTARGLVEAHRVVLEAFSGLDQLSLGAMREIIAMTLAGGQDNLEDAAHARMRQVDLLRSQRESTSMERS